jgi:hypothetical protein
MMIKSKIAMNDGHSVRTGRNMIKKAGITMII